MRVYVFPADEHGCGHYRLIWPSEVLKAMGHDIVIVRPSERDQLLSGVIKDGVMVDVKIPADADVMVFQRTTHLYISQAVRLIRERGVAVVVDMDDDLTCIHPANPAYAMLHPRSQPMEHNWQNALNACADATMVTVSTEPLLRRYAPRGHGRQFDNYIPCKVLDQPRVDNEIIGWAGSLHSHPADPQDMGSSVNRLMQEGAQFAVIGAVEGMHGAWGVPGDWPILFTGPTTVHDWTAALGKLGIGVAPLADTKFNAAKSWLKMLEYAAAGVPCVASDRAEYTRLFKMGIGVLARSQGHWYGHLKTLRESADYREELSQRGRNVAAQLTIEANAWKLWEIWVEALKSQRGVALGGWSRR